MHRTALTLAIAAIPAIPAAAQTLDTELIADGFDRPLFVTYAPGDHSRLFVVEQRSPGFPEAEASIRVIDLDNNQILPEPFLTVTVAARGNEQGLLGLAFHPDFSTNGLFFVNYTRDDGGGGITVIERYRVDTDNPNTADPASAATVLTIDQPFRNHNGGWIRFAADGTLYIASGDGGSGGDPDNNAQDTTDNLLGKILRIDIDADHFPSDPERNYAIPADNPLVGQAGDDEILALGVRNPWRNSIDATTGDLYIADVGQDAREEVSVIPAANLTGPDGPVNLGWRCYEGDLPFNTTGCPPPAKLTFPIYDYVQTAGRCSITGGEVYRGCAIPDLSGTYFFADLCTGEFFSLRYDGAGGFTDLLDRSAELQDAAGSPVSFGRDARGELYIVTQADGAVRRIVNADGTNACPCPGDTDLDDNVNLDDLLTILSNFGTDTPGGPSAGDLDNSGDVDLDDLLTVLSNFGATCP